MKSHDKRGLRIPPEGREASHRLADFVSDSTCTIILYPRSLTPDAGTAICFAVGERCFLATAAHVIEAARDDRDILLLPRGELNHPGIPFLKRSDVRAHPSDPDVGWLELAPAVVRRSGLRPLPLTQLASDARLSAELPFLFIQGFPSREIERSEKGTFEPLSLCLLTTSVDPGSAARGVAVEYPPQDPGDAGLALVHPGGFSGGGIWTYHPLKLWPFINVEAEKLSAIITTWDSGTKRLYGIAPEYWLERLSHDIPEVQPVAGATTA